MARWQEHEQERGQSGQSIVLVALVMAVLLGFMALTVDAGFGYIARRQEQNAADAASLAAARLMAEGVTDDSRLVAEVTKYVALNRGHFDPSATPKQAYYVDGAGHPLSPLGEGFNSGAAGVSVIGRTVVQGFFSQLLGQPLIPVSAQAVAVVQTAAIPTGLGGLVPLALPEDEFVKGQPYTIWDPQYSQTYGITKPNNWKGALDYSIFPTDCNLHHGDPKRLECWAAGLQAEVPLGANIKIIGGDKATLSKGLEENIASQGLFDSGGQYGILLVPVFDAYNEDTQTVHISNFAALKFYLDGPDGIRSNSAKGTFVSFIDPDGVAGSSPVAWGPRVIKLIPPPGYPAPPPTIELPTPVVPTATPS